jgi:hypothetical protein
MKRFTVVFSLIVCLAAASFGFVSASDYEVLPGVLSPDEVDFGGKTVTIVSSDFWKALPTEERMAEAEEVFNVNIETLLIDNADLMIARIMSGDSTYDIIQQAHRVAYFLWLLRECCCLQMITYQTSISSRCPVWIEIPLRSSSITENVMESHFMMA